MINTIIVSSSDASDMFPMFFCILIGIMIVVWIFVFFAKRTDNHKELILKEVKILEKTMQQGSIEWYIVECENGERLKLRNLQANNLLISIGDCGTIGYKGKTIQSFQKK